MFFFNGKKLLFIAALFCNGAFSVNWDSTSKYNTPQIRGKIYALEFSKKAMNFFSKAGANCYEKIREKQEQISSIYDASINKRIENDRFENISNINKIGIYFLNATKASFQASQKFLPFAQSLKEALKNENINKENMITEISHSIQQENDAKFQDQKLALENIYEDISFLESLFEDGIVKS